MVIDNTGSVEDIHAFIYCKKWRFGRVSRMPDGRTHSQTLKDRATQLLIKYKNGAPVTQFLAVKKHDRNISCRLLFLNIFSTTTLIVVGLVFWQQVRLVCYIVFLVFGLSWQLWAWESHLVGNDQDYG